MSTGKYNVSQFLLDEDDTKAGEKGIEKGGEMPTEKVVSQFQNLCEKVRIHFESITDDKAESNLNEMIAMLESQKKSIIGYGNEINHKLEEIKKYLISCGQENTPFPPWYDDLISGIFHENYGLAGIAEWFTPKYKNSTSAKIIGERIFFMEDGRLVQKPQTISEQRREQLKISFLMKDIERRKDEPIYEVYRIDGTRISILTEKITKAGQEAFTLRRYIIPEYTFAEQVRRHTIPGDATALFEVMVKIGYNVIFTGAVRTAKTTFLSTWQACEDPALEGVMIETDPEIPLHIIMPKAPVIQIVADDDKLKNIIKPLMRTDADYIILAEARDGIALDIAVKAANKGTNRVKATYHTSDPEDLCYDIAAEIVRTHGGILEHTERKVAKSFDYIFHFTELSDKNQKRLAGIYELGWDGQKRCAMITQICRYSYEKDSWSWQYCFSKDKIIKGEKMGLENLKKFRRILSELTQKYPMKQELKLLESLGKPCEVKEDAGA